MAWSPEAYTETGSPEAERRHRGVLLRLQEGSLLMEHHECRTLKNAPHKVEKVAGLAMMRP